VSLRGSQAVAVAVWLTLTAVALVSMKVGIDGYRRDVDALVANGAIMTCYSYATEVVESIPNTPFSPEALLGSRMVPVTAVADPWFHNVGLTVYTSLCFTILALSLVVCCVHAARISTFLPSKNKSSLPSPRAAISAHVDDAPPQFFSATPSRLLFAAQARQSAPTRLSPPSSGTTRKRQLGGYLSAPDAPLDTLQRSRSPSPPAQDDNFFAPRHLSPVTPSTLSAISDLSDEVPSLSLQPCAMCEPVA
jgi:hypothetical protein